MFNTKMKVQWEFLVSNQMSYNDEDKSLKKETRNVSKALHPSPFCKKAVMAVHYYRPQKDTRTGIFFQNVLLH